MAANFAGKVFFYCLPPGSPDNTGYPHTMVCLGEGLKALGIEFYANINYWQLSPETEEYLFRHDPEVTPDDCDIVILNHYWFWLAGNPFPQDLFHPTRKYITVYLDSEDGSKTHSWNPEFRQFDFIFKIGCNSKLWRPSNVYLWGQGLSKRMLQELKTVPSFQDRKKHLLVNFRESIKYKHSVRDRTRKEFFPQIQKVLPVNNVVDGFNNFSSEPYHYLQWAQTGRRHSPNYYKSLKESVACACFTGFFITPWPKDPGTLLSRFLKRTISDLGLKSSRIVDWDGWRFWESLAAGCVSIREDFDKYGFILPVKPENWRHYVGIDFDNIQESVDRVADDPGLLERIAIEGRSWALEHYTPVPTTIRFLETLGVSVGVTNTNRISDRETADLL